MAATQHTPTPAPKITFLSDRLRAMRPAVGQSLAELMQEGADEIDRTRTKSFDRIVDVHDLDTVCRALAAAENEIHNPGFARANNYDVLDLIDQARTIAKRAIAGAA